MIELPFPPAMLSAHANGNNQWKKIALTKEWRAKAREKAERLNFTPFSDDKAYTEAGDIELHITFVPPTKQGDRVNFPSRIKPVIDGIADALGVNDARFVPKYYFCQPQKPGRIEIRIGQ